MDITCPWCNGSGFYPTPQDSCAQCGGDGNFALTDPELFWVRRHVKFRARWAVRAEVLSRLAALEDKVDNIIDKCNDIFEKVSE